MFGRRQPATATQWAQLQQLEHIPSAAADCRFGLPDRDHLSAFAADDVDAVQAQIARNMLTTGDYVTARLDGIAYLEKPPLIYWLIAGCYKVFGVHDWAARIPVSRCSALGLVLLTAAFGVWAFGKRAGFYAGLVIATCVGLYLFTRVLIPDVILTFTISAGDVGAAARHRRAGRHIRAPGRLCWPRASESACC